MKKIFGFTLVGLIMAVAILAILSTAIFVSVNPVDRVDRAKDIRRQQDLSMLAKALKDYTLDNQGQLPFTGDITTRKRVLCNNATRLTCGADSDICLEITNTDFLNSYLPTLPVDPDKTNSADSGYYIQGDLSTGQLTIGACDYEQAEVTQVARIKTTVLNCDSTGVAYGGYCWYGGASNQTCDSACATHGGCVAGNWNDETYEVCDYFSDPSSYGTAFTNAAPYYTAGTTQCAKRFSAISQSCSAAPGPGNYRFCACTN